MSFERCQFPNVQIPSLANFYLSACRFSRPEKPASKSDTCTGRRLHPCCSARALSRLTVVDTASASRGRNSASYFYPGTMHQAEASTPGPREPLLQLTSFAPSESGAKCPSRRPLHPCCGALVEERKAQQQKAHGTNQQQKAHGTIVQLLENCPICWPHFRPSS